MRNAETRNQRSVIILETDTADAEWETVPAKPFGALVIAGDTRPVRALFDALARRLIKTGCAWATLHAGRNTRLLHDIFDRAVVDYQLKVDADAEMMTSGEDEDSLEEAVRDAVWDALPSYDEPYEGLLVIVVGLPDLKVAEQVEALVKSVEAE